MNFIDIFLIGVALSMDAFAVSICKGLSVKKVSAKHVLTVGVYFGGFQALMPTLGFLLGYRFESFITRISIPTHPSARARKPWHACRR